MPIEIKELHIHVVVNTASGGQAAKQPTASDGGNNNHGGDKDTIVAECVEQVLEILKNKKER
ncbi:MAG: DUF5908 family protein [Methylococcaceae bacterium]